MTQIALHSEIKVNENTAPKTQVNHETSNRLFHDANGSPTKLIEAVKASSTPLKQQDNPLVKATPSENLLPKVEIHGIGKTDEHGLQIKSERQENTKLEQKEKEERQLIAREKQDSSIEKNELRVEKKELREDKQELKQENLKLKEEKLDLKQEKQNEHAHGKASHIKVEIDEKQKKEHLDKQHKEEEQKKPERESAKKTDNSELLRHLDDKKLHMAASETGTGTPNSSETKEDCQTAINASIRSSNNFRAIKATQGLSDEQIRDEFLKVKDARNGRFGGTFTGVGVDDDYIHLYANGADIAVKYSADTDKASNFNDPKVREEALNNLANSSGLGQFKDGLEKLSSSELSLLEALRRNDGTALRASIKGINNAEELSKQLDHISDFWIASGHTSMLTAKWSEDLTRVAIHYNGYTIFNGSASAESDN